MTFSTPPPFNLGLKGEDLTHAEIVRWARHNEKNCSALRFLYHCPSGGHRHPVVAMKLRALGVVRGIPDLHLPVPVGRYAGLWIEVKDGKKGRVSEEQQLWIDGLRDQHQRVEVVRSAEEGIAVLQSYLSG